MRQGDTIETVNTLARDLPPEVSRALWAVGGAVRDWAMGRMPRDLDLVTEGDVSTAGRAIARATGGHFFMLHPATQTARVALSESAWVDLVPLPRGLDDDLRRRDFTMNAMAMPFTAFAETLAGRRHPAPDGPPPPALIDPAGGWGDLHRGIIRMTARRVFDDDPLRAMRGLRLAATLTQRDGSPFALDPATEAALRAAVPLLARVSAERVRDEWMLLMDQPRAEATLRRAAKLGFLDLLTPEWRDMPGVTQNPYHHLDVWDHTLDVVRQFDRLLHGDGGTEAGLPDDLLSPMREHLAEPVTPPHARRALAHTAILLHDIGKPATRTEGEDGRIRFLGHERTSAEIAGEWSARWRLSGRQRAFLTATVGLHMRPGSLIGEHVTDRAIHRFFRDAGDAAPTLLLINAADRLAARGPWTTEDEVREQTEGSLALLRRWLEMKNTVALPLPVSGRDLMAAFSIEPGPEVGRLIQTLRSIHSDTPFPDRDTALEAAAEWMHAT